jgi:hypothetical protein
MRGAALLGLAACGGAAPPAAAPSHQVAAPAATPARDEVMVESGRTFVFDAERTAGEEAPTRGEITCRVTRVETYGEARYGELRCDPPLDGVDGFWAVDAGGLWRLYAWPSEGNTPGNVGSVWLAAAPVAGENREDFEEGYAETSVFAEGDAWCVRDASGGMGEFAETTLCHDAAGIVRGEVRTSDDVVIVFRRLDR